MNLNKTEIYQKTYFEINLPDKTISYEPKEFNRRQHVRIDWILNR